MSTLYREQLEVELHLARGALTEGGTHRHLWVHGLLQGRAFNLTPHLPYTRPFPPPLRWQPLRPWTHPHALAPF